MTSLKTSRAVAWALAALLACALGAAAQQLASGQGLRASAPLLLLGLAAAVGLAGCKRALGRMRLRAALDAYAEREIGREHRKPSAFFG